MNPAQNAIAVSQGKGRGPGFFIKSSESINSSENMKSSESSQAGATVRAISPIRVLIVDDHPLVRSGIKQYINDSADMEVVGEAGTAKGVFDFLAIYRCDVLVLDIGLPDQSGLEVLRVLKKTHPWLPVLMLSMYPEDQFAPFCLRIGAAGFLSKANAANHLVDAIRKVATGFVPALGAVPAALPAGAPMRLPHEAMAAREYQIFCLIGSGRTPALIAAELELSLKKVRAYRLGILEIMHMTRDEDIVNYIRIHHLQS